jgi:competence protein ComEC
MPRPPGGVRRTGVTIAVVPLLLGLSATSAVSQTTLRIYHIDVNQADATLLVSPSGNTLLIDSGDNGDGPEIKAVMDSAGVTSIDHFVCTHYHADHYGGIDDLVNAGVTVGTAYDRADKPYVSTTTLGSDTYEDYDDAVGADATPLRRRHTIELDPDVSVVCLAHGGAVLGEVNPVVTGDEENDMSIVLLIEYGDFRYFTGGDLFIHTEEQVIAHDLAVDVDVYQSNHHGSETSSCSEFMTELDPSVIIISNGNDGRYEHPRQSVLDIYATDTPQAAVFQTNKYLGGGDGGNVADAYIADLEPSGDEGTILVTVDDAAGTYEVSYRDTSITFQTKDRQASRTVVIESLLPDAEGSETEGEVVTLRNEGTSAVSLADWTLVDIVGGTWDLDAAGTIASGESKSIPRNGMQMGLNNDGDHIYLLDPDRKLVDHFGYWSSSEGVNIETGH